MVMMAFSLVAFIIGHTKKTAPAIFMLSVSVALN